MFAAFGYGGKLGSEISPTSIMSRESHRWRIFIGGKCAGGFSEVHGTIEGVSRLRVGARALKSKL